MTEDAFAQIVEEGIQRIPPQFRRYLDDVALVIEEWPTAQQRRSARVPRTSGLLGLYEGTPCTERQYLPYRYPEKITLFRRSFEEVCGDDAECMREEVAETVWHELAHALGMNEDHVRRAEKKRRKRRSAR